MTWKLDRGVLEKPKGEHANSAIETRAVFLASVLDLLPNAVTDLWTMAFGEFLCIVSNRFKSELIGEHARTANSGGQVLAQLFIEASHKLKTTGALDVHEESIVCLAFSRFRQIDSEQLKGVFPNWTTLLKSRKTGTLKRKINAWSVRWNLDADWCREHALNVLCEWITDEALKWAFISPGTQLEVERRGWQRATSGRIWHVQWSRVRDALSILDGSLNPFEFQCRGVTFESPAWNYLKQKESDWRLRTKLRFCAWLSERELERISPLVDEAVSPRLDTSQIQKEITWRHGALTKFDAATKAYLQRMRSLRKVAKSQHKLIDVDEKPKLQEHIEWTVRYQVEGQSLSQIASSLRLENGGLQKSTVSRGVEDVLLLIGLKKRFDATPRRLQDHRNSRPRILRELGR